MQGYTLLHCAAEHGRTALVSALLGKGADVNAQEDHYWNTPLMFACSNGHESTALALIALGADIHARDDEVR